MKFNQYFWNLYINSTDGVTLCSLFAPKERNVDTDAELVYSLNKGWRITKEQKGLFADFMEDIWALGIAEHEEVISSLDEARVLYEELLKMSFLQGIKIDFLIPAISLPLNYKHGEYFIPYLFTNRFSDLKKIADFFEIEIPSPPKKSDYYGRFMYYWELCVAFYQFRIDNNLSPQELAAFLYGYAPKTIDEEENIGILEPSQAWFIGGVIHDRKNYTKGFWQANPETKKGDILIHYETYPICAITCMWIAQTDGVIDPFVHYYSNSYIGNKTDLTPITLNELKKDAYFSCHPLVRKNFQGVNGWAMTCEDYRQLHRILKEKGENIERLPALYVPYIETNPNIKLERDVETLLLEPLLNSMGYFEGKDYIRQLPIRAGRGHKVFLDYALHFDATKDYEKAAVLIEAKLHMKNNRDIDEAFSQALSYARPLESNKIILCDKECLMIFSKNKGFDRNRYNKFYWGDIENPDRYNELKKLFKD